MSDWLQLLGDAVAREGSKARVAGLLGVSRSAVSLALAGKYPAGTAKLEARVLDRLAHRVDCPYLGRDIAANTCRSTASQPMSVSSPAAFRAWRACQTCPHKPTESDNVER